MSPGYQTRESHRSGLEVPKNPSKKQLRNKNGNGIGSPKCKPSGGRPFVLLYRKLEADHQRSLGFRDRHGSKLEFRSRPQQTGVPRDIHMDMEKARALTEEIEKLFGKGAIIPVLDSGEGFISYWFQNQTGHGGSEAAQRAHHLTPFQDGICEDSQEFTPEGQLVGETRPQRRILDSAHAPGTSEVSVAEPILAVQGYPFWPRQCPVHIYEADEAGSVTLEEPEHQDDTLLGLHVDHG